MSVIPPSPTRPGPDDAGTAEVCENAERPEKFENYVEAILGALSHTPDRTAVTDADGGTVTRGEFRDRVYRMAAELRVRGIERGSTLAFLIGNEPDALIARYAANLLGARVVFLSESMAPQTLARLVHSVRTAMLVLDPAAPTAEALLPLVRVPKVLAFGPAPFGDDLAAHAAAREPHPVAGAATAEDDWCIRHTGGTTGVPKGIRMPHGPYRQALAERAERLGPDQPDGHGPRFLACTPLAHLSGVLADVALLAGGEVVLRRTFDAGDVLATVAREGITDTWLLPPLLYEVLDHPTLPATDLSTLRRIFYGGTPASPERLRQAAEALGPVLHGAYGQTEAGWITEVLPHEHGVTGRGGQITVGRAALGVTIEVRDAAGNVLDAGETGEVHVRSPMMMSGYWEQPELTADVLRDGRIRTGDVGYLDADGYLYIVDRVKDMVVVVGGHVYPAELEQLLLDHPGIAQCAVFGVRGPDRQEEVHAAVVPARNAEHGTGTGTGTEAGSDDGGLGAAIRQFVTEHLGAMYAPAAVHVVDRIPLTDVGKPDKKLLRSTLGADSD